MPESSGVEQADATRSYVSGLLLAGVHRSEGYTQVLFLPLLRTGGEPFFTSEVSGRYPKEVLFGLWVRYNWEEPPGC